MIKLVSWNVNGLRACILRGSFTEPVNELCADIICLQETKMERWQAEHGLLGYEEYWNSAEKKGYSGTAVFTRRAPISVSYGLGIQEHDSEGRVIKLEFEQFVLVNVYTPNSRHELSRLPYRLQWEDDLCACLKEMEARTGKPLIICGDLNVAHQEIDIKNAKSNHKNPGFTDDERSKMTELLAAGFYDTFRYYNPELPDAYTWWSYQSKARERNVGWRIDYFLVSKSIIGDVKDTVIYSDMFGSDHCPVGIVLDAEF